MFLDDFFSTTVEKVMETLEVNYYDLTASKERKFVDARSILVSLLVGKGMTQADVAERLGMTRQGVNRLVNGLHDRFRCNQLLKDEYERLRNEITPR
jgi:predicted XRE-type DNA-binding protein